MRLAWIIGYNAFVSYLKFVLGEHTVQFFGEFETFEIKHTSYSRNVFAEGALKAAKFLADKPSGLYNMDDIVKIN